MESFVPEIPDPTLDGIIIAPPLDLGGDGQALSDGVGGVAVLQPRLLKSQISENGSPRQGRLHT